MVDAGSVVICKSVLQSSTDTPLGGMGRWFVDDVAGGGGGCVLSSGYFWHNLKFKISVFGIPITMLRYL